MMLGLCSVTFRELEAKEIVRLAQQAGLDCIEWAAQPHLPPGGITLARQLKHLSQEHGLHCPSYGTYLRCEESSAEIEAVLDTAVALGATTVRVWAGSQGSDAASDDDKRQIAEKATEMAKLAAARKLDIAFEYHRHTLNDSPEACTALLASMTAKHVGSYWQPATGAHDSDWIAEMSALWPHLSHIHVFALSQQRQRLPLAAEERRWREVLAYLKQHNFEQALMLEFVPDDQPQAFLRDASLLKAWLHEA